MAKRILLLSDFYIHALGQIGQSAVGVADSDGLAEHVEYLASGLAVSRLLKVGDDCGAAFDCYLDFEGDLLASVNEGLPYGERIA